jgi:hypothetical protein
MMLHYTARFGDLQYHSGGIRDGATAISTVFQARTKNARNCFLDGINPAPYVLAATSDVEMHTFEKVVEHS